MTCDDFIEMAKRVSLAGRPIAESSTLAERSASRAHLQVCTSCREQVFDTIAWMMSKGIDVSKGLALGSKQVIEDDLKDDPEA